MVLVGFVRAGNANASAIFGHSIRSILSGVVDMRFCSLSTKVLEARECFKVHVRRLMITDVARASKITSRETLPGRAFSRATTISTASMLDGFSMSIAMSQRDNIFIPLMYMLLYDTLACIGSHNSVEMHNFAEAARTDDQTFLLRMTLTSIARKPPGTSGQCKITLAI